MGAVEDLIFTVIGSVPWRHCTNLAGDKVIGPENALVIHNALRAEGFEIVAHDGDAETDPSKPGFKNHGEM